MRIRIKAFAAIREVLGRGDLELEVPEDSRVRDAFDQLAESHPALKEIPCGFGVDHDYVTADHPLREGDELALLPPVGGG